MYSLDDLCYLMSRLRDDDTGCPWDTRQDFRSLVKHTLEETYEVIEAIETNDLPSLEEELGDLFFQVIFYCQIAQEQNLFSFSTVIDRLVKKLLSRHPHVFPEGCLQSLPAKNATLSESEVHQQWERLKQIERDAKGKNNLFGDIPQAMPAMIRSVKLQKRLAENGMDWQSVEPVFDKLQEEIEELGEAWQAQEQIAIENEIGDVLFTCTNLARILSVNPEQALRNTNRRFVDRCLYVEHSLLKSQSSIKDVSDEHLDELWEEAKQHLP